MPHLILKCALCLIVGYSAAARAGYGQTTRRQSELETAISKLESGDIHGRDVVVLANAGAVQAIPTLEENFRRATDYNTKAEIALGLVKLRDGDDTYWNFLLEQATVSVESNVPDVI